MLTRREFIKLCLTGMASMSLSRLVVPEVAQALLEKGGERPPFIWLECDTCVGDYFSFLNTLHPDVQQVLFQMIEMHYSNSLMVAEGGMAINYLEKIAEERYGDYILVVEGTVPTADNGCYSLIGHRPNGEAITDLDAVRWLAKGAKYILAAGTCASFGGPYAADPNPTGSKAVHEVIDEQVINVPGCPVHPDWIVGTLSHVILYGVPDLDAYNRPTLFYGQTIHDKCPRRADFEEGVFAAKPGDSGCLYKIGCKGPVTYSDCPTRQWIGDHTNWPVEANTPCIGCVAPGFPDRMAPFFKHLPDLVLPGAIINARTAGTAAIGAAVLGLVTHFGASIITGRFKKHMLDGTETDEINPDLFTVEQKSELDEISGLLEDINKKHTELEHKIHYLKTGKENPTIIKRTRSFIGRLRKKSNHTEEEKDGEE